MSTPTGDFRAMNQAMVERLSAAPAQPIAEGGYGLRVLEVVGRRSGRPVRVPIGVLVRHGERYLVCPDRTRDWPRNLRAAGRASIAAGGGTEPVAVREVTGRAAAEVVAAYLAAVTTPWAVAAFGLPPEPTPDQVEPELGRMAVFAVAAPGDGS